TSPEQTCRSRSTCCPRRSARPAGPASTGWTTICSRCCARVPPIRTRWPWCAAPASTASAARPTGGPRASRRSGRSPATGAAATTAARRLGMLDKPHAVVLGGGVLAARHPLLHEAVLSGIQAAAPKATIGIVADPPVAGAALLALDAFGPGTPEVESAVRAA